MLIRFVFFYFVNNNEAFGQVEKSVELIKKFFKTEDKNYFDFKKYITEQAKKKFQNYIRNNFMYESFEILRGEKRI